MEGKVVAPRPFAAAFVDNNSFSASNFPYSLNVIVTNPPPVCRLLVMFFVDTFLVDSEVPGWLWASSVGVKRAVFATLLAWLSTLPSCSSLHSVVDGRSSVLLFTFHGKPSGASLFSNPPSPDISFSLTKVLVRVRSSFLPLHSRRNMVVKGEFTGLLLKFHVSFLRSLPSYVVVLGASVSVWECVLVWGRRADTNLCRARYTMGSGIVSRML